MNHGVGSFDQTIGCGSAKAKRAYLCIRLALYLYRESEEKKAVRRLETRKRNKEIFKLMFNKGKWNANTYVKGIHIRFRPEGASDDNITSRTFKDQCSLATYGVEEKVDLTPEEQDPTKKVYIKKVTPLDDWITEQTAAQG